jgi:hypothetical protein
MTHLGRERANWTAFLCIAGVEATWFALLAWLAWRG